MNLLKLLSVFLFSVSPIIEKNELNLKESVYNASINDASVENLFSDYFENEESGTFLNNYANIYFYNLRSNFPLNSHGTCSFTAMSMLLSFIDSYFDDDFVDDTFEMTSCYEELNILEKHNIHLPSYSSESPGVTSENFDNVQTMSNSEYQSYIIANKDNYLQSHLLYQAYISNLDWHFDSPTNLYGLSLYSQGRLLLNYLSEERYIYGARSMISLFDSNQYSQSNMLSLVCDYLNDGIPVILNIQSSLIGSHSVVAYDYDSSGNIYVHSGLKKLNGKAITHISLNELETTCIDSGIVISNFKSNGLNMSNLYEYSEDEKYHSSVFSFPRNVMGINLNDNNSNKTIKWDSLYEEWFDWYDPYIEISVLSYDKTLLLSKEVFYGNECEFTQNEWNQIISFDIKSFFYVELRLKSDTYEFIENSCLKAITKPCSIYQSSQTILTTDYSTYRDEYTTNLENRNNFITHTIEFNNFKFLTRRYRAGYIHGEYVTFSCKRLGYTEAFIEYQFLRPIDRLDIDISHWREVSNEGLTKETGKAVIQEYKYGQYNDLVDLLSSEINLSQNRNEMTRLSICFSHPTSRIRLYSKTYSLNSNDNNKGRISVGSIELYENFNYNKQNLIPTYGGELPYNPDFWNDLSISRVTNCYLYAINDYQNHDIIINPGLIGDLNNYQGYFNNGGSEYFTFSAMEELVKADGRTTYFHESGFLFVKLLSKYDNIPTDAYRVALVFDNNLNSRDYHWYRQNSDGFWSHKYGTYSIRDFDADGNPILDPEFCNRNYFSIEESATIYGYGHDYSGDINYYYVQIL